MAIKAVYADHAATTPLCDAAWAAMTPFLREEFGNPNSLYSFAKTPREAVSAARATIAECIGAEPEEIVFTSGGTESDNWVIKGTDGGYADPDTQNFPCHGSTQQCRLSA